MRIESRCVAIRCAKIGETQLITPGKRFQAESVNPCERVDRAAFFCEMLNLAG
jgi:hypothetical protein